MASTLAGAAAGPDALGRDSASYGSATYDRATDSSAAYDRVTDDTAAADEPTGRLRLLDRLAPPLPADRLWGWLGPGLIALFAAVLRFDRLSIPKGLVFDEVYYAKDSLSLLRHGVEFDSDGKGPGFIVHPPLGKWAIALGQAMFGHTEFGWRFAAAVAGSVSVLVLARVARRMTRSTLLGCVAGLLLALDGLHFVQSRVALLDIFLMAWVVGAFACLVADRDAGRARLATAVESGGDVSWPGPRLGVRWWRIGAGLCLGAACATKWSGAYYVLGFGLLAFAWEVGARRTAGLATPVRAVLRRDALGLALAFVAVPVAVYVLSWTGWFVTGTGWDRHWATGDGVIGGAVAAWRGWWHYHWEIYHFHTTLTAKHPYQSHPAGWLLLARPVSYFYASPKFGELGCTARGPTGCSREVLAIGTPAIWWPAIGALVATLWLWISRRDWRAAAVLVGAAVGILPWIRDDLHHRTMFLFYALPALPFLVLALTLAAGLALGPRDASAVRRRWGAIAVGGYLCLVAVNFFGLYPVLAAKVIPYSSWQARMWFSSWV